MCGVITIVFSQTGKVKSKLWILAYFLATAAVLVPAPLIEFRYYTIPFYFLVLHCNIRDDQQWLLTGMLYVGVNIFTMMMFLFRPFHWDHEPGIQRFIWWLNLSGKRKTRMLYINVLLKIKSKELISLSYNLSIWPTQNKCTILNQRCQCVPIWKMLIPDF